MMTDKIDKKIFVSLRSDFFKTLRRMTELEELLQKLCDLQEGPPLIKYEDEWNAVMKRSREVLDE